MASDLQEFDREIAVPKAENREIEGGGRGRGDWQLKVVCSY